MSDFNFDSVAAAASDAWRDKLSPITISPGGVDKSFITSFYSGIYRTMVNPQNVRSKANTSSTLYYSELNLALVHW